MIGAADSLQPSRLLPRDVLAVGSSGLRARRLRAALSALGVAIGIASMVAVLGISASSQADLLNTIDRLGTNLLSVQAGQSLFGDDVEIPKRAEAKLASLAGVEKAAATYAVEDETVRRNALVDEDNTSGISVQATDRDMPSTLGATVAAGRFLTAADARYPTSCSARSRRVASASRTCGERRRCTSPISTTPSSGSSTRSPWTAASTARR